MSETDVSKTGFFIVLCIHKDGTHGLVHKYDEVEQCDSAYFKTEKAARFFRDFAQARYPEAIYYTKYVSWNEFD